MTSSSDVDLRASSYMLTLRGRRVSVDSVTRASMALSLSHLDRFMFAGQRAAEKCARHSVPEKCDGAETAREGKRKLGGGGTQCLAAASMSTSKKRKHLQVETDKDSLRDNQVLQGLGGGGSSSDGRVQVSHCCVPCSNR